MPTVKWFFRIYFGQHQIRDTNAEQLYFYCAPGTAPPNGGSYLLVICSPKFTGPRSACHSAESPFGDLMLMNIIAWGPQVSPNFHVTFHCHTLQTRRAALPPARESNETSVGIAT